MRVWIDISNSPQVPFFRPLIALLSERGHDVHVTTREYAQTTRAALAPRHSPRRRRARTRRGHRVREDTCDGRAAASASPLRARARFRHRAVPRVARASARRPLAGHPVFVRVRLRVRARPARLRVSCCPTRRRARGDPPEPARLASGARASKVRRYPGAEGGVLPPWIRARRVRARSSSQLDRGRVLVVVRTPPEMSLYHRHGNPLFEDVLERLGRDPAVQAVVLPRTAEQGHADPYRAPRSRRPRSSGRCPEPRRPLRPRRLRGGHDEPRSGRTRCPGLHDVRRHEWARSTRCSCATAGFAS